MCSGPPWRNHHPDSGWSPGLADKRRFWFRRFVGLFGVLGLIFLAALGLVISLAVNAGRAGLHPAGIFFFLAFSLAIGFILLVSLMGRWAFRNIGRPLADVMAAADEVAAGNFQTRLHEDMPGELGRLAQSFNRMTAELERSEQQRRNLTADVAHELRTPLHIIQGNLEGIIDGVYQPTPEHINATLEESRLLARLVDDLQTLSLAEAGQLPLHQATCSISDLLDDTAASFSSQAAAQGVELQVDFPEKQDSLEITADPDRLAQVLANLVSNALRYTPAGGKITISARRMDGSVRLQVADTGTGIAPEDLPYIFDRFWRADRSRHRTIGAGSGLGLAIARQIVRAHGGSIEAQSNPGKGTIFILELPANLKHI